MESTLNKENPDNFPVAEIVTEILRHQFGKRPEADMEDCLVSSVKSTFKVSWPRFSMKLILTKPREGKDWNMRGPIARPLACWKKSSKLSLTLLRSVHSTFYHFLRAFEKQLS